MKNKTQENLSSIFDEVLWKHVRIIKEIDIPRKLGNLFLNETSTQENRHVYVIEIKLLDNNTGKKQNVVRWIPWFEIKISFNQKYKQKWLWIVCIKRV